MTRGLLLFAALVFLGCRSDRSEAITVAGPKGMPLQVSEEPRLSVGVVEGDTLQEFDRVVTPFLLPRGALVVPLAGSRSIRVFEPDGRFSSSMGRPGEGPGEFMSLDAAWARGDTVEAFDGDLSRVLRFPPDGPVEMVTLEGVASAQAAIPGTLGDGWVLYGVASVDPGSRDQMRVHHFGRSGAHLGELGALEGMLRYSAGNFRGPTPLSPKWLLALHDDEAFIAESLTPLIKVVDSTGKLVREIAWEPGPSTSVEDALREVIDSATDVSLQGQMESTRARLGAAPVPDRLSAFWGLIVDAEGFTWIRPFDALRNAAALGGLRGPGKGGTWLIFGPDGARVGEVRIPDDLEPVQITSDAVVGIRRDVWGVESVQVYSLTRS